MNIYLKTAAYIGQDGTGTGDSSIVGSISIFAISGLSVDSVVAMILSSLEMYRGTGVVS